MEIKKRLVKAAAVSLTAGVVTLGGLGMAGVASADDGGQTQAPPNRPVAVAGAERPGFLRTDLMTLAARKLGISSEALQREMSQGRSIKQIATARGVVYADLKTTLVNAEGADLQDAVAKGTVTQAQANLIVSNIPQRVEQFLTRSTGGGPAGRATGFPGQQAGRQGSGQQAGPQNPGRPGMAGPMAR